MRTISVVLAMLTLSSCNSLPVPWSTGRLVLGTEVTTATSDYFKHVQGSEPLSSTGTRGFDDTCEGAAASTGSAVSTGKFTVKHRYESVGHTKTDAPLVPGVDTFSDVPVSVIAHQTSGTGTLERISISIDSDDVSTTDRSVDPNLSETFSRYFGLAADEFLVQLYPLNMYVPADFARPDYSSEGPKGFSSASPTMGVSLLTRRNPSEGEVWTSLDGRRLYRYGGFEEVSIGGEPVNALRVDVFTIAEIDPDASSILGDCFSVLDEVSTDNGNEVLTGIVGDSDTDTDVPDTDTDVGDTDETDVEEPSGPTEVTDKVVYIDGGCEDSFVHQQVGSEWWFEDTLVKASTTTYSIEIEDFGFEWYDDEGEDSCTRMTSTVMPTDEGIEAKQFVEYGVTKRVTEYAVDSIGSTTEE